MEDSGWKVTALDAVDAEGSERILARVQDLPEVTRRVVTLRKVYGLTQEQIADRVGLTLDGVEEHLAAAVTACADMREIGDG